MRETEDGVWDDLENEDRMWHQPVNHTNDEYWFLVHGVTTKLQAPPNGYVLCG